MTANQLRSTVTTAAARSALCAPAFDTDPVDWTGFYLGGNISIFTGNFFTINTERYGIFAQLSYRSGELR